MKKLIVAVSMVACALASQLAQAEKTPWYSGASYHLMEIEQGGASADLEGIGLTGGYRFNEYFAMEVNYIPGFSHDEAMFPGGDEFSVELKRAVGGDLIGSYDVHEYLTLFARAGFYDFKIRNSSGSFGRSDISYGAGLIIGKDKLKIRLMYSDWFGKNSIEIDGYSVGLTYNF